MSKFIQFQATLKALEREGLIMVKDDTVTILGNATEVKDRLMETQWGALLLMGALPDAMKEIKGGKHG